MIRYFFVALIILVINHHAHACSCDCFQTDVPVEEIEGLVIKKKSDFISSVIFEGVLKQSKTQAEQLQLTFSVQYYYKGQQTTTEIDILTSRGDCGFRAPIGDTCLIFGYEFNGELHTYSSQCSRSVGQTNQQEKYTRYKRFMEIITKKPDGTYQFSPLKKDPYVCKTSKSQITHPVSLIFNIKENKLDGEWVLYNFDGAIIEKGQYKQGIRTGEWMLGSRKIRFATPKPD